VIRSLQALCLVAVVAGIGSAQRSGEPLRPEWCSQLPRPEYKSLERVLKDESWFEIYRIRPGVFAIYEPKQFEEVISYLILGEKRALLFDTGLGVGKISAVVTRLTPLSVTVVNSHTHFDHVGGNAEFKDIWNRDLLYTRKNMHGQPNIYSRDALAPERLCGLLPSGTDAKSYSIRPWKSTHPLRDRERIDLGGRVVEVIFTPGHTPDSVAPARSQERTALYWRQFLSRPDLSLRLRDRLWRLHAFCSTTGGTRTPDQVAPARAQRTRGGAGFFEETRARRRTSKSAPGKSAGNRGPS
jgi:hypothetical protein